MKKFSLCFSVLAITSLLYAQNQLLTIEDAVLKQRTLLAPERLMQPDVIPNSNRFSFVRKLNGKEVLIAVDANRHQYDTLLTIDQFKVIFKTIDSDLPVPERFPFLKWKSTDTIIFQYFTNYYVINIKQQTGNVLVKLPKEAENIEPNPTFSNFAFTIGNNVVSLSPNDWAKQLNMPKVVKQSDEKGFITKDGQSGIQYGTTVHRSEFGITKGLFWSPNGQRLAFYKQNETAVTDYRLMNFDSKPGTFDMIKYPMAGATSHTVSLMIKDFEKNRLFEVDTKAHADQYLTNISWSVDGAYLYIVVVSRNQKELKLNQYDGRSGVFIKTLFSETNEKYIEPEHPPLFLKNGEQFIWMSKKDGFQQLYLYSTKGKFVKQLTSLPCDITEVLGLDEMEQSIYFLAAYGDGLERQLYRTTIAKGNTTKITTQPGMHKITMLRNGRYFLDNYSNTVTPGKTLLLREDGAEVAVLLQSANPLAAYSPCIIELGTLKANDTKTNLNYRMIRSTNLDTTKKHPVIVYVYGGPHAQLITNSWLGGADLWLYYMAQQGYVVFTIDNRGSANRGITFEQATHKQFGKIELQDQLTGLQFVRNLGYVDSTRVGVFGWSFGGFMSTTMITRTPHFKVGVAGGPVIDWRLYEIMYTERYMEKPQENEAGYKDADLTNYVNQLTGKLLLIHGTDDDVVLWQHSLTYLKKCVEQGVDVDYFVYPDHKHNVLGKDRVHLMKKVSAYFKLHL
ncbi:MAG: S9 family peptidase [Bacteroidia bacterium]|jgi:dipeptidyl-peptidase-4|nr:S9 family peptidase [Bacteroidia bacterium]